MTKNKVSWKENAEKQIGLVSANLYKLAFVSADPHVQKEAEMLFKQAHRLENMIKQSKWVHAEKGEMAQPIS